MAGKLIKVDERTHTDAMEQLQEAYVGAVASTAGVSVQPVARDNFKYDLEFMRQPDPSKEEVSIRAQLKSTTQLKFSADGLSFSYQFESRAAFDDLVMVRTTQKRILVLMLVHHDQNRWTYVHPRAMLLRHCCLWLYMEGMTSAAEAPTVSVPCANVFDAAALTGILDRIEKGGTP